jgi:hypothetical protein
MDFPAGPRDLYLTEIGEPIDNQLRIVLCEAVLGDVTNIDDGDFNIQCVRPMAVTDQSISGIILGQLCRLCDTK